MRSQGCGTGGLGAAVTPRFAGGRGRVAGEGVAGFQKKMLFQQTGNGRSPVLQTCVPDTGKRASLTLANALGQRLQTQARLSHSFCQATLANASQAVSISTAFARCGRICAKRSSSGLQARFFGFKAAPQQSLLAAHCGAVERLFGGGGLLGGAIEPRNLGAAAGTGTPSSREGGAGWRAGR